METLHFAETERRGLRKGTVLYFNNRVEDRLITVLEGLVEQFLACTGTEFTKKRGGSDYANIRNLRGGWKKVFHRELDPRPDRDSLTLTLENSSPEHVQQSRVVFQLTQQSPVCQCLYLQWPAETEWSAICGFLRRAAAQLEIQYASAGYEMASNIHHFPGSAGQAVRALEELPYVNSEYTEWGIRCAGKVRQGIPCPNFVQLLGPALHAGLPAEAPAKTPGLHREWMGPLLEIDLLDRAEGHLREPARPELEVRYAALYRLLRPVILPGERSVYMKPAAWARRSRRFEPGAD